MAIDSSAKKGGKPTFFDMKPCPCVDSFYFCVKCGSNAQGADTSYTRVWNWRNRYGNIGGSDNGIGEGNEGVQCGRGSKCLAARDVEVEVDADLMVGTSSNASSRNSTYSAAGLTAGGLFDLPLSSETVENPEPRGPYYGTREIHGLGGVVKKKMITTVRVGACVPEWDEERETCSFLKREREGLARSWCAWCQRVIPGPNDKVAK